MCPDELETELARLRERWPVGSIVDPVMERIRAEPARSRPLWWRRRVVAALAGSGLLAASVLAWMIVSTTPRSVRAAVQDGLGRAASAHLTILAHDEQGRPSRSDVWYRRGEGMRAKGPGRVLVEDGRYEWTWDPEVAEADRVVFRQPNTSPFVNEIGRLLDLDGLPSGWVRRSGPEHDAVISGVACRRFIVVPPDGEDGSPGPSRTRVIYFKDGTGRIRRIEIQQKSDEAWKSDREITIAYDEPVAREQVEARLPEGVRVVDRNRIFEERYPLDRALSRVEVGGLILAVHDLRPMAGREGFFVVSSVRGTAEHVRRFPPHRRMINTEASVLEVASQPVTNRMLSGTYDLIGLASAAREGVEYAWWMIVPRRHFRVEDGRKVFVPELGWVPSPGEPGRLDDFEGQARIPLRATYDDPAHRGPDGLPQQVERWATTPLPPDARPLSLEEAATRTRADLRVMRHAGTSAMLGVAPDARAFPGQGRPLSGFDPDATTDADYAAAVRRGLEDMRAQDQLGDPAPFPEEGPR
ncbi:LolA family protein [Tundrisphaera sp. TA3]|uniref:LolA family protein n=1 Tax=Tundrisphaera sp. TA3 TaxID=3435775 RepID=UPI003EB9F5B4